jgi:glycosyltransferase involved in cell wall biosynthesis
VKTSDAEVSALLAASSGAAAHGDLEAPAHAAVGMGQRILFVVNNASFFESHRLSVAQHARRIGYAVGLCTGHEASPTLAEHALPKLKAAGLEPKRVSFRSARINPLLELIGFIQLVLYVRRFRPTLLHCASPKGVLYGGLAARLTGVPALVLAVSGMGYAYTEAYTSGHASASRRWARAAYEHLARWAYAHPNKRVIVQNEDDAAAVTSQGLARSGDVRLIAGSGVVLDDFVHLPLHGREPLIVLPARMLRDKGVVEFVQAAKALRATAPEWRFVLAGTADYDNPSAVPRSMIEQWQRDGDINWMGHISDPKAMVALYARAAIVCLPSYREGMPRVLLEAAAAGCAVVTTDAIGCRDAIENGVTGDLVPVGNSQALANALQALIHDPDRRLRYGAAGRERAQRLFGIASVHHNTMAIYRELLSHVDA